VRYTYSTSLLSLEAKDQRTTFQGAAVISPLSFFYKDAPSPPVSDDDDDDGPLKTYGIMLLFQMRWLFAFSLPAFMLCMSYYHHTEERNDESCTNFPFVIKSKTWRSQFQLCNIPCHTMYLVDLYHSHNILCLRFSFRSLICYIKASYHIMHLFGA